MQGVATRSAGGESPGAGDFLFDAVAAGVPGPDPQRREAFGVGRVAGIQDNLEPVTTDITHRPRPPRLTVVVGDPSAGSSDGRAVRAGLVADL